jgi:quinolinate synthase
MAKGMESLHKPTPRARINQIIREEAVFSMPSVLDQINTLKQQRNAVVLAHYYQQPEIQDMADFVGDSFDLSRRARDVQADVIVFCGVYFMAESAKILNPGKTVLLPVLSAGCPMADMVTPEDVLALREKHPGAAVVCYVNSSAAVKAESDICCTSSNAVKIVKSLPQRQIIFVPDRNLGHFVSRFVPEKEIIFFQGFCPTHERVGTDDVAAARHARPGAKVLVHPECPPAVVDAADFAGSTAQIIQYAAQSDATEFIIGTEQGILHRLQAQNPGKRFYLLSPRLFCVNMKKTALVDVLASLETMTNRIELEEGVAARAYACLDRMLQA